MKRATLAFAVGLSLAPLCAEADGLGPSGSPILATPTSTLTLTSATTAYSSGQLIANNATAGSVVVPSVTLPLSNLFSPRVRLSINDSTSTAWGGVGVQIDLWSTAPTFTNGDRGTFAVATGSASHLATYSCTLSAVNGDGVYSECGPSVGSAPLMALSSTAVYWTAQTTSATGVTGASKVMTLTMETLP